MTGSPPVSREQSLRAAYSEGAGIYRIVPEGVATPRNVPELQILLAWARSNGVSLVPRGAGSGTVGGNVGSGIIVDLTKHFSDEPTVAGCHALISAGTTFAMLDRVARRHGQRLPPEPSSADFCTLGGMVACNAAGARSLAFGSIREWVEGLTVVWPDGTTEALRRGRPSTWPVAASITALVQRHADEIRHTFPRTRKNSAGYALDRYLESGDIIDLLIGSEGTLAFVTDIEVRLTDIPESTGCLLVGVRHRQELGAAVEVLSAQHGVALELLDRSFLDIVRDDAPVAVPANVDTVLIAEFEANSARALRHHITDAARAVSSLEPWIETGLSRREVETLWQLRHAASPVLARLPETRRSLQVIEDGCVPVEKLGDYLDGVRLAAAQHEIEVVMFGHAGDGHIHINALVDLACPGWQGRLEALFADVTALVGQLGGTVSGEHGDGRLRARTLATIYSPPILELFRTIKTTIDPHGILNPGVIIPDESPTLRKLKVGREREPIPDGIADGLRRIERAGAWGTPKDELSDTTQRNGPRALV